ncbi:Phosphatidylinositol-4-phosphate 3-kinase C2 domain-containing subunit alpha [Papilio machaon]|uniref:Phosphatidylinositol-4-phosphate 3-kinase C2 domain-containing subunit alpha n=1 Tax=Papilio machaon TaxID=76193 RepID=A0A0N1IHM8_PAPMA|nr:Phosphatidylinositol-4-phosphate 3-kinase C2 domain-containing subunit alpha [Papilio machaon]
MAITNMVGDDLRQDALVLQVIKVMDTLWLKAGLDLRIVTFQALPTSNQRGMIEIVSEAETLRAIQTEWGLTGSFKDKPIAEWLAKHNPSELEYQRARDNFTDRAPFVLTHDMAYVINGGERPTQRFQHFVELCCMAFNVVRAHRSHILDLFALVRIHTYMATSLTARFKMSGR